MKIRLRRKKIKHGAGIALFTKVIFGLPVFLFKYPVPTIGVINSLILIFLPDNFITVFTASVIAIGIYYAVKRRTKKTEQKQKVNYQATQKNYSSYQTYTHPVREKVVKPQPSPEEIRKLYHDLAKKYHPDRAQSEETKRFTEEIMVKINKAYQEKDVEKLRAFL
jgi:preprotein translocase subunit Sec63